MKRKHYQILVAVLVMASIAVLASRMHGTAQAFAGGEGPKKIEKTSPIIHWHPRVFILINGN